MKGNPQFKKGKEVHQKISKEKTRGEIVVIVEI